MNRDPAVLLQTVQRFRFVAFFVLVIGAGAYLRFHDLGRSQLWLDELVQLMRAHHASVWACLLDIGNDIGSAPLDYLIQRAFVSMWGVTPWTARFHAAVFGTLSIPMIYVTARRLFSVRTSFISMVLFSVYPLHRYYSQEGRNYALFVLLTLVSWYLLLRLSEKTEAKVWVAAVVTNVLLLYTNDLGVVVLAGQSLFAMGAALMKGAGQESSLSAKRYWKYVALSWAIPFVTFLPWILGTYRHSLSDFPNLFSDPYLIVRVFREISGGSYPLSLGFGLCLLLFLVSLRSREDRVRAALIVTGGLLPIVVVLLLEWYREYFFAIRHILFATPFVLVAVAFGISRIPSLFRNSSTGQAFQASILSLLVVLSLGTIGLHRDKNPADWQGLADYLEQEVKITDIVVAPDIDRIIAYLCPDIGKRVRGRDALQQLRPAVPAEAGDGRVLIVKSIYMQAADEALVNRLIEAGSGEVADKQALKGFQVIIGKTVR